MYLHLNTHEFLLLQTNWTKFCVAVFKIDNIYLVMCVLKFIMKL